MLAGTIPVWIMMFGGTYIISLITNSLHLGTAPLGAPSGMQFSPYLIILPAILSLFSPAILSILGLTAWAIARGVRFNKAFRWGWLRYWRYPLRWWWAGLVLNFVGAIGFIACYLGLLISLPWAALAAAEIAGYEGEPMEDVE
jgi:hypothetical protein